MTSFERAICSQSTAPFSVPSCRHNLQQEPASVLEGTANSRLQTADVDVLRMKDTYTVNLVKFAKIIKGFVEKKKNLVAVEAQHACSRSLSEAPIQGTSASSAPLRRLSTAQSLPSAFILKEKFAQK